METSQKSPESTMAGQAQKEHQWLQKLVGDWTFQGEATMEPDKPADKFEGAESVRALGELWIVAEGQGEMPGCGTVRTIMTLGFNPRSGRFVGTFIASMMPHLWVYDGALDGPGTTLALDTEGPDKSGKLVKYRDVIEIQGQDRRTLTSHSLGADGLWRKFMAATYLRRK